LDTFLPGFWGRERKENVQEIKKVAIIGAGAMGSFFAAKFFETDGFSTVLLARGERRERLMKNGLIVNGKRYDIPVVHPDKPAETADLIIVALKHHHLAEAVHDLKNLVGDNTTIISVMNGLESEEMLASAYGWDKVLYCVSVGIDALREGNSLTYTKPGKHFFGQAVNTPISERVKRVQRALDSAGITYETPEDMIRIMWWKFMINVGTNQASAVMRASYGVFRKSMDARELMRSLMMEVVQVSKVAGVNLEEKDIDDWEKFLISLSSEGKTSMFQDIEAGRKTEVEIFGGKVVDLGKKYSVPTPVNEAMLRIIRVLEQYPA
jgi:2-dehydropantoate 2-reductase